MNSKSMIICGIIIFLVLHACKHSNEYSIIEPHIKEGKKDSSFLYQKNMYSSIPHSLRYEHLNQRVVNGNKITATLTRKGDSILVINSTLRQVNFIKLPLNDPSIVSTMYFHNYDSIFIFFDREYLANFKNDGESTIKEDFILIDSTSKIINKYSLDSVPYIYNGQLEPMMFKTRWATDQNWIKDGMLYIPFSIYSPELSEKEVVDHDFKFLCQYNLKNKEYHMIDIGVPAADVGKKYKKRVINNSIHFSIDKHYINYSYFHSSTIYRYNLKNGEIIHKEFDDFPFNNIELSSEVNDDSIHSSDFFAPVYCEKQNLYIRKIDVTNYKDYKFFNVSQILDSDFNLLGYNFSSDKYSNISIHPSGNLVVKNNQNYLLYFVDSLIFKNFSINYLEDKILIKKKRRKIVHPSESLSYSDRIEQYIKNLNISDKKKFVLISSSHSCSSCLDYLLTKHENSIERNDLIYVIFGEDKTFIEALLKNYGISDSAGIIADTHIYREYIKEDEYHKNPFVLINEENEYKVFSYKFNEIKYAFEQFKNM
ncbi:MAG: hypothetical protein ACOC22_04890 [bacterium]